MDYIKILENLISIDTTMPPGENYLKAITYLDPLFQQAGCKTEVIRIPPEHAEGRSGRVNLVCHRREPGKPRMIFYGHIDVVPAEGWPAFQARRESGRVYGRGAADMKGGIVALLAGLEAVKDEPLQYDTSVIITTDEEFSQATQLIYIARFLQPLAGSHVFSLDSGFGGVGITGLGVIHLDILVKGKSVHSGMSHQGINAVEQAIPILNALMELKERVVQRKSSVRVHPATDLTHMVARLNINVVKGGLKVNIVPDECLISVDRRLIPEEDIAAAEKELMDTLQPVSGVEWEIADIYRIPPVPPVQGPVVDKLEKIIKTVTGSSGQYGEMGSGDLSSIVAQNWGGQEFSLGVIRPECNIHGRNEFVYEKDITDLGKIIALFLRE